MHLFLEMMARTKAFLTYKGWMLLKMKVDVPAHKSMHAKKCALYVYFTYLNISWT